MTARTLHLINLLCISGDIHLNPGPNYRNPCGVCTKPVRSNEKGIWCDSYDFWLHAKCISLSTEEYDRLSESEEPWFRFKTSVLCQTSRTHSLSIEDMASHTHTDDGVSDNDMQEEVLPPRPRQSVNTDRQDQEDEASDEDDISFECLKKKGLHYIHLNVKSLYRN